MFFAHVETSLINTKKGRMYESGFTNWNNILKLNLFGKEEYIGETLQKT